MLPGLMIGDAWFSWGRKNAGVCAGGGLKVLGYESAILGGNLGETGGNAGG